MLRSRSPEYCYFATVDVSTEKNEELAQLFICPVCHTVCEHYDTACYVGKIYLRDNERCSEVLQTFVCSNPECSDVFVIEYRDNGFEVTLDQLGFDVNIYEDTDDYDTVEYDTIVKNLPSATIKAYKLLTITRVLPSNLFGYISERPVTRDELDNFMIDIHRKYEEYRKDYTLGKDVKDHPFIHVRSSDDYDEASEDFDDEKSVECITDDEASDDDEEYKKSWSLEFDGMREQDFYLAYPCNSTSQFTPLTEYHEHAEFDWGGVYMGLEVIDSSGRVLRFVYYNS